MNTKLVENAKEVRDLVYLALQEHNDWVTSSTIANELGLGRDQVKSALTKLKTQHPEIISSKSFGYKITAAKKNSEGYFKGIEDGKKAFDTAQEEHKEALAEEHQRGLREGTDKGYDKGYKDGYDACKKELDYCKNDAIATEEAFNNLTSKPEPETQPETVDYADVVQLITERNLYKTFYEQLLEVMKS